MCELMNRVSFQNISAKGWLLWKAKRRRRVIIKFKCLTSKHHMKISLSGCGDEKSSCEKMIQGTFLRCLGHSNSKNAVLSLETVKNETWTQNGWKFYFQIYPRLLNLDRTQTTGMRFVQIWLKIWKICNLADPQEYDSALP